jgi:hypothetical protein
MNKVKIINEIFSRDCEKKVNSFLEEGHDIIEIIYTGSGHSSACYNMVMIVYVEVDIDKD